MGGDLVAREGNKALKVKYDETKTWASSQTHIRLLSKLV